MWAIRGLTTTLNYGILQTMDKKIQKLNLLAKACMNSQSNDFKALWYKKMIDLAREYNMMDYVMRKLVH